MRTSQQALQDALDSGAVAAFIAGKSIDYKIHEAGNWKTCLPSTDYSSCFSNPTYWWRPTPLSFPEPPAGESWHNPDNLAPELVGEGYRLLLVSELKSRALHETIHAWYRGGWDVSGWSGSSDDITHRVSSLTPFHWDAPKRIPLAPEDFIGATLRLAPGHFEVIVAVKGNNLETYPTEAGVGRSTFTIDFLTKSDTILIRLANTTEFVNCYKEEAV